MWPRRKPKGDSIALSERMTPYNRPTQEDSTMQTQPPWGTPPNAGQGPTPDEAPTTLPGGATVAELEAQLSAAREAEAVQAQEDARTELTLEGLDTRISDIERRLAGGAPE